MTITQNMTITTAPSLPRTATPLGADERATSIVLGSLIGLWGLRHGKLMGLTALALGGGLIYRGVEGKCHVYKALGIGARKASSDLRAVGVVTVQRPPDQLYQYWRKLDNLPRFMSAVQSVEMNDPIHSHWIVRGPLGRPVQWDAEITQERENEFIAWRSTDGADVANAGYVRFRGLPFNRGTEVRVELDYETPGGKLGAAFAAMLGESPAQKIHEDLRRFKQIMEADEVSTIQGQTFGNLSERRAS